MFLKCNRRFKDGKDHRYWSIVENKRTKAGRVVQRQVLYLGEINDSQKQAWLKSIEVFEPGHSKARQVSLFPSDSPIPPAAGETIQVELNKIELRNARQWGACWLFSVLWDQLGLDHFWKEKLLPSRKGTRWLNVFKTLTAYRLLDPGSEWWLHCSWYQSSAMELLRNKPYKFMENSLYYFP